jgi:uncharacterized membrane protein
VNAGRLQVLLIAAGILGCALLEYYSNRASAPRSLGAALAVAPLLLALGLLAQRLPYARLLLPLLMLAAVAALLGLWPRLEQHFTDLYLLQQCGIYLSLAIGFGRSLLPGRTPLCTRWARQIHGTLSEEAVRYTRGVTVAWTAFFLLVLAVSGVLYATASRMVWSAFADFAVLPLAALLFAAEYRLRHYRLPAMSHASLAEMLRAYLADRHRPHRL